MSLEFIRRNKFRKKKLDRLIYVRNINSTFNHEEPIEYTVENCFSKIMKREQR